MIESSAERVVEELSRRLAAGDETALDDLVAADMVNRAAGPQGREGLRQILRTIEVDLGPVTVEEHWRFIHVWRVGGGVIVDHWACRDDMALLEQVRG